ncbi:PhzF family phenazine biosynthesis protein [Microbacterium sp. JZ31]|uniref:PhzF family phenazine biosynthesis protein n=1 Tax=Microbacterium sp. JZ31 TaxID=1906274 RepID=UPI0019343967|nr:PhzF family phenazine biosynthesis protein [Microbacterium sp. JZ31]
MTHTATADPEILRLTAFAATPAGGNPAGVVLDARDLDDAGMQRIAAAVGYSETAFAIDPRLGGDERHVAVRYFSPTAEVPFCGHATIALAVALAERRGTGAFRFATPVGEVVIGTEPGEETPLASFTSVEPSVRALDPGVADELLELIGVAREDLDARWPLREAFAGNAHPIVAIRGRALFDGFSFDPAAVRALMDRAGWAGTVTVVRFGDAPDAVEARNLFPVGEITEDPATGSAAAALGAYVRDVLGAQAPSRIVVQQGAHVGRPSILLVDIPAHGGITVSGTAVAIR